MIVLGLLSIILAAISPIFGLIFIIPLAGKRILKNPAEAYVLLSTMTVVIIGMLLLKYIDILGAYSMLFGFAFESVLFLYLLTKSNDFEKSICITGAYGLIVISLREFLMNQQYVLQINAVASQINKILENEKSLSQIQLTASKEIVLNMKQILIDYQIAIWIIVTAIGLYLGTLLYYRVTRRSYDFATIRLPFAIIYFLILSLALYLWKGYKIIGANLILSCGVFFFNTRDVCTILLYRRYTKKIKNTANNVITDNSSKQYNYHNNCEYRTTRFLV